jgi:hypothetical protein
MANQITCITKPDPHNSHEAITHVGGVRANGAGFYITRQECAGDIVNRQDTYFVRVGQILGCPAEAAYCGFRELRFVRTDGVVRQGLAAQYVSEPLDRAWAAR